LEWVKDLDWGNVPAFAGALSLFLAFSIFVRDRSNADRAQVDLIGTWAKIEHYPKTPDENARVRLFIKNSSQLPMEIVQLAFDVHGRWLIPSGPDSQRSTPGVNPRRHFLDDLGSSAPDETWSNSFQVNVADTMPQEDASLNFLESARCSIMWLLLIDNAGRRWEIQPGKGGRAKRVRWYSRLREYQPRWFKPVWLRYSLHRK